jgi:hypothetical protein
MYTAWGSMVCNSQQRPIFEKYQNYDEVEEFVNPAFSGSIKHHRSDQNYNFLFHLGENRENGPTLLKLGEDLKYKIRKVTLQEEGGKKEIMPGEMTIHRITMFPNGKNDFGQAIVRYADIGTKVVPKNNTFYTLTISGTDIPDKDCPNAQAFYLTRYADVKKHKTWGNNPWGHFSKHGKNENRVWNSAVCSVKKCATAEADYLKKNKDVEKHNSWGKDPWGHYGIHGFYEGRLWDSSLCTTAAPAQPPIQQGASTQQAKTTSTAPAQPAAQGASTQQAKPAQPPIQQGSSTQQAKTTSTAPAQPAAQGASTQQAKSAQPPIQQGSSTQQAKAPTAAEKAAEKVRAAEAEVEKAKVAETVANNKNSKAAAVENTRIAQANLAQARKEAEANANAPAQAPIQQTPTQTKQGKIGTISPYQNYEGYYDDEVEQFAHCSYY